MCYNCYLGSDWRHAPGLGRCIRCSATPVRHALGRSLWTTSWQLPLQSVPSAPWSATRGPNLSEGYRGDILSDMYHTIALASANPARTCGRTRSCSEICPPLGTANRTPGGHSLEVICSVSDHWLQIRSTLGGGGGLNPLAVRAMISEMPLVRMLFRSRNGRRANRSYTCRQIILLVMSRHKKE